MNKLYAPNRQDITTKNDGPIGNDIQLHDAESAAQYSAVSLSDNAEEENESEPRPASVQRINPVENRPKIPKNSGSDCVTVRQLAFLISIYKPDMIF